VTEQQLRQLFASHGAVKSITIVKDRDTGEPRGVAWVEIAAIIGETGCEWRTRKLALDPFPAAYEMDSL